jgi:hypothetical protein
MDGWGWVDGREGWTLTCAPGLNDSSLSLSLAGVVWCSARREEEED